jgi:peroxiredoxin
VDALPAPPGSDALEPERADVARYAALFGFRFPVATDVEWRTLRDWWMSPREKRQFTSASFLIDRRGIIRHVHPGGKYARGEPDHAQLQAAIERLCEEPAGRM